MLKSASLDNNHELMVL